MNLYKKSISEPYSFLVIDTTIASYDLSNFRKKYFRKNVKTNQDN